MKKDLKQAYSWVASQMMPLERVDSTSLRIDIRRALLESRFPQYQRFENSANASTQYNLSVNEYRNALAGMSSEELTECLEERGSILLSEVKGLSKELAWWSQPNVAPDFEFWKAMDLWRCDEAIILSLGLNPKKVKLHGLIKEPPYDVLPKKAKERSELVIASVNAGKLASRTATHYSPPEFIAWLESKGLDYPSELSELISPTKPILKPARGMAREKQKRKASWHKDFNDYLRRRITDGKPEKPNIHTVIKDLRAEAEKHDSFVDEVNDDESVHFRGANNPIQRGSLGNQLRVEWKKIHG